MTPQISQGESEPCGCKHDGHYHTLCGFHWNESNLKHEVERARSWERRGPLDPDDCADQQVLRFFEQLCYWAAKGIGEAGSVGSIYSAAHRRRHGQ